MAVEHVVGAVVQQQRAARRRFARQHGGGFGVDALGGWRVGFGLVDGGVGGGVDDQPRPERAHGGGQAVEVGQVATQAVLAGAVQRHQCAQRRQRALQLPAHLAVLAQQQNVHAPCPAAPAPYCTATQSR